jgi:hypothetical protein
MSDEQRRLETFGAAKVALEAQEKRTIPPNPEDECGPGASSCMRR